MSRRVMVAEETAAQRATARVICGANDSSRYSGLTPDLLAGLSVAEIRERFGDILNIPAGNTPYVAGHLVAEGHVLGGTETLEFVFPEGQPHG